MHSHRSVTVLRHLLLITAGMGLAFLLASQTATAQNSAQTVLHSDTADAVVDIRGMACQMCAENVKRSLEDVEGINAAHVHLDEQRAVLTLTEAHSITEDRLRTTVEKAGYEFKAVKFTSEAENSSDG